MTIVGRALSAPLKLCRHLKLERITFVSLSRSQYLLRYFQSNDLIMAGRADTHTQAERERDINTTFFYTNYSFLNSFGRPRRAPLESANRFIVLLLWTRRRHKDRNNRSIYKCTFVSWKRYENSIRSHYGCDHLYARCTLKMC